MEIQNDIDVVVMWCFLCKMYIYLSNAFFTSGSCYILLCNQFFFIYCVGVLQNHSHFFVSKMSCWIPIVSNGNQQGPHSICGSPKYLQYYTKILNDAWFLLNSIINWYFQYSRYRSYLTKLSPTKRAVRTLMKNRIKMMTPLHTWRKVIRSAIPTIR